MKRLSSAFRWTALAAAATLQLVAAPPAPGDPARDFSLTNLQGKTVSLSGTMASGTVVLVFLRGYPGYQCPVCNRQVQDLNRHAKAISEAKARVILVYPGPGSGLTGRAGEFMADKQLEPNIELVLDPDYKVTNLYDLRWDAPKETAYPSTFVIGSGGRITFSKVSSTHGGRASAAEVLEALRK